MRPFGLRPDVRTKQSKEVNVDLYSVSSRTRLWCATASRTSALISVKLAYNQTPVHTTRPWIRASVSRDVPVYSAAEYSFYLPKERWVRLRIPGCIYARRWLCHPASLRLRHSAPSSVAWKRIFFLPRHYLNFSQLHWQDFVVYFDEIVYLPKLNKQ